MKRECIAPGEECRAIADWESIQIAQSTVERLGARLAARVCGRYSHPMAHADLFVTENCNHRCEYCFVKGKNRLRILTEEVAKQSVEFLLWSSQGMPWIQILFFGGEPLLEFGLIQSIVGHGRQRAETEGKEARFSMTTNGTLMTEDIARYLGEEKIHYLLSIDGQKPTHDAHRQLLNGGSSYGEVMSRLPMMKRYQPWQGSRLTVHPDTVGTLREDVEFLFHKGINQFIIGPATGIEWPDEALGEYERQMFLVTDFYKEMKAKRAPFRMTLYEKDLEGDSMKGTWGCGAGRGRVCISTKGELYGCAKILGVDGLKDTHKLGDIWNGVTNLTGRRDLLNTNPAPRRQCLHCEFADECSGGCPAVNWEATGSIFQPSPLECKFMAVFRRIKAYYHNGRPAVSEKGGASR